MKETTFKTVFHAILCAYVHRSIYIDNNKPFKYDDAASPPLPKKIPISLGGSGVPMFHMVP